MFLSNKNIELLSIYKLKVNNILVDAIINISIKLPKKSIYYDLRDELSYYIAEIE